MMMIRLFQHNKEAFRRGVCPAAILNRRWILLPHYSHYSQHCSFASSTGGDDNKDNNPLETIQHAMESLDGFSERLKKVSSLVDQPHSVPTVILPSSSATTSSIGPVTLAQMVLHSRDADPKEFSKAESARRVVLETANEVTNELKQLYELYQNSLFNEMSYATQLCQNTPCGGLSWEIHDMETLANNPNAKPTSSSSNSNSPNGSTTGGNQKIEFTGMESTPCGRLQLSSMNFLETTYETKSQIIMGSRALLIINLAIQFNKPLQEIRTNGTKEENLVVKETFQRDVIPTPWIRSNEEYQQLLQIKQDLT